MELEREPDEARIPERVLEMRELYDAGGTLGEVAERFGISRERVRQLFRDHGLPTRSIAEAAALRREQLVNDHHEKILELIDAGVAPKEVAERLGISPQLVRHALRDDPARRRLAAFRRTAKTKPKPKYSDEEIIECLRTANVELGGVLTTAEYTSFARPRRFADGRRWPLHQTASNRFGSWRAALQRAGLEANPPSAIAGQRLFTREHCVDAILEVERALGHPPTAAEYERAAVASNGTLPSLATVRHRCGSWQEALVLAARFSQ
jgi:DNA-binding CsgD family transcriptional regulator